MNSVCAVNDISFILCRTSFFLCEFINCLAFILNLVSRKYFEFYRLHNLLLSIIFCVLIKKKKQKKIRSCNLRKHILPETFVNSATIPYRTRYIYGMVFCLSVCRWLLQQSALQYYLGGFNNNINNKRNGTTCVFAGGSSAISSTRMNSTSKVFTVGIMVWLVSVTGTRKHKTFTKIGQRRC